MCGCGGAGRDLWNVIMLHNKKRQCGMIIIMLTERLYCRIIKRSLNAYNALLSIA
jgi:hypothetical protein